MISPAVVRWAFSLLLVPTAAFSQAPPNDLFENATIVSGNFAVSEGTTVGATPEPGEPDHTASLGFGTRAANSVWYSWTVAESGIAQIVVDGEVPMDTLFAVYTGSTIDALTSILDVDTFSGQREIGNFEAVAGTTYHIATQGFSTDGTTVTASPITVSFAVLPNEPPNDDFASATLITSFPAAIPGSNFSATIEEDEPDPAFLSSSTSAASNSVWYRWQPTEETTIRFTTRLFLFGVTLAAFEGETLDQLIQVAGSDLFFANGTETFPLRGLPGRTYNIVVDGNVSANPTGTFILEAEVVPSPENDAFVTPGILPPTFPTSAEGTTIACSAEPGEPNHLFSGENVASDSSWWIWTSPVTDRVVVSCRGEVLDAVLAAYEDTALITDLSAIDTADDGSFGIRESVIINVTAGTTYRFAVDASSGSSEPSLFPGDYIFRIDSLPENDNFANAIDFGTAPNVTLDTSSIGAGFEPDEPNHGFSLSGNLASNSVWFTWEATTSENYAFTAFEPEQDAIISIYTGTELDDLTLIAEADAVPFGNATESVAFDTVAGTSYHIAVDTFRGGLIQGGGGLFQLQIRPTSDYGSWIALFPEITGEDTLPTANPTGDGIPNLLKQAYGLNPTLPLNSDPARANAPAFETEDGIPTLRFTIVNSFDSIPITVESSQDLVTFTPVGSLFEGPVAITVAPRTDRPRSYTRVRAEIVE